MLATFYAKAVDAGLEHPVLGDRFAKDIVDRIDYDWKKTAITATNSPAVTTRSAHFDHWARQFVAVHPEAVVLGCDGELQQVFANLVINAVDAMSETPEKTGERRLTLGCEVGADTVRLWVRDNGPGIPAERREQIFQPFFSTKLHRGGTGLGLPISHEIVRRHGGTLTVASEPGEGACFTVELPRSVPSESPSAS